jgi:tRNA(fMet)-specific endonuclease VapC
MSLPAASGGIFCKRSIIYEARSARKLFNCGVYYHISLVLPNLTAAIGGVLNPTANKISLFEKMYSVQGIGVIDKAVLDIASMVKIKMQRRGKGISDDDLFIAAYCLRHKLPLVTNNTRHFINIEGLEILNWVE